LIFLRLSYKLNCIVIRVKENGKVANQLLFGCVLTHLKARGMEDIIIVCTNNLKGFTEAIKATFPQTDTQLCVVHQVRNSTRYVVWNDKKEFAADLKTIYNAVNQDALQTFKEK
jgi:putative transposase